MRDKKTVGGGTLQNAAVNGNGAKAETLSVKTAVAVGGDEREESEADMTAPFVTCTTESGGGGADMKTCGASVLVVAKQSVTASSEATIHTTASVAVPRRNALAGAVSPLKPVAPTEAASELSATETSVLSRQTKDSSPAISATTACARKDKNAVQTRIRRRNRTLTTQNVVKLAVFTALSYVLYMFVKFPLPFLFPSWLDFQISDLPALMAGFMVGPTGGVIVIVLKCLLKMPFSGTAFVGELADIAIGIAFVLPAALLYRKRRTKKGALLGIAVGSACCIAVSVLANALVLIPFYVQFYFGGNEQILVNMLSPLFPSVTWKTFQLYYLPLSVLPFNLLRCALSGGLTFLLYKRMERLFYVIAPKKDNSLLQNAAVQSEPESAKDDGKSKKDKKSSSA